MLKYKLKHFPVEITPHEIVRETNSFFVIEEYDRTNKKILVRCAKKSSSHSWHDSVRQAKQACVVLAEKEIKNLKEKYAFQLDSAIQRLEKAKHFLNSDKMNEWGRE